MVWGRGLWSKSVGIMPWFSVTKEVFLKG